MRPRSWLEATGPPGLWPRVLSKLRVAVQLLSADIFRGFCEAEASLVLTIIPSVTYFLLCLLGPIAQKCNLCRSTPLCFVLTWGVCPGFGNLFLLQGHKQALAVPPVWSRHVFFIFFEWSKEWSDSTLAPYLRCPFPHVHSSHRCRKLILHPWFCSVIALFLQTKYPVYLLRFSYVSKCLFKQLLFLIFFKNRLQKVNRVEGLEIPLHSLPNYQHPLPERNGSNPWTCPDTLESLPAVYLRSTIGVAHSDFWQMYNHMHLHYSSRQDSVTAPNPLCSTCSSLPLLNLWQPLISLLSPQLRFSTVSYTKITRWVAFSGWLLSLINMHSTFPHGLMTHVLLAPNISLLRQMTVYPFTYWRIPWMLPSFDNCE